MRDIFIEHVIKATSHENPFAYLEKKFNELTKKQLSDSLVQFGIMPEVFNHDSSEEKNWAKLSDIILSQALNYLGIKAEVLRTRGNSADVFGKNEHYTLVGDAKTFRLSRTAKNQKDFKIKALDDWRRENTYAVLVSPLSQYPSSNSQIYTQAIDKNVTLLSYMHLKMLVDKYKPGSEIEKLWVIGKNLKRSHKAPARSNSKAYWHSVNQTVAEIAGVKSSVIETYKEDEIAITKELGNEGISYWQKRIEEYKLLSKAEAISKLIKAEKLESKILTIKKAINFKPAV